MKKNTSVKYILIVLFLTTTAYADKVTVKLTQRKNSCGQLNIRFPWGACRVNYCGKSKNPLVVRGYACGTYTVCLKRRGNKYLCWY